MQEYVYYPEGTCSREMHIFFEDGIVKDLQVIGGCNGNLKAIASLVEGQDINEVIKRCKGINCNNRGTSCADQLAKALESIKEN